MTLFLLITAILLGLYTAMAIGGNDVANAMGTSVGSKALSFKEAVLIAGVFEFAGAVLVGSSVTNTIRKGMIDPAMFLHDPMLLVYGMLAALIATALWLQVATHFGLPVSTTHSIVGAIIGFGLIGGGFASIHWGKLVQIVLSWIISPVMGAAIAFGMFTFIRRKIIHSETPVVCLKRYTPYLVFLVFSILFLSLIYKGLKSLHLDLPFSQAFLFACMIGTLAAYVSRVLVNRIDVNQQEEPWEKFPIVERVFSYLQIMTASYVAFAHGANDVANSIGPLAAVVAILHNGEITMKVPVPLWVLLLGGGGIVIGLALWGEKVIETVGRKITEMTPSRGFAAEFGAATTVLVCSKMGLPISTTHTLVGAVIGVGMARGMTALNMKVLRDIVASWLITVPLTAIVSMIVYKIFLAIF